MQIYANENQIIPSSSTAMHLFCKRFRGSQSKELNIVFHSLRNKYFVWHKNVSNITKRTRAQMTAQIISMYQYQTMAIKHSEAQDKLHLCFEFIIKIDSPSLRKVEMLFSMKDNFPQFYVHSLSDFFLCLAIAWVIKRVESSRSASFC